MGQYAFAFDSSACSGCKTCQVACQEAHDLPAEMLWRQVTQYGGGSWEQDATGIYVPKGVFRYFVSVSCNHCANPACVEACPTGAMVKNPDTGIVTSDPDVCIGCATCAEACPYGAPVFDEASSTTYKCDMCIDRLERGEKPACVEACPGGNIEQGEIDDLAKAHPDAVREIAGITASASETKPNVLISVDPKIA